VASLRQDPDVILVGEIRDLNTIRTAITAAETGHLVLTTVHAGDCVGAVERLVSVFPADEQMGIRRQLAMVLRCIVAQHLLIADGPGKPATTTDGAGRRRRVVASEVMMVTPAVANLIATAKSSQIYSTMETGAALGMQTLEQDLARLWVGNLITEPTATMLARNPQVVRERAALLRKPGPRQTGGGR
jgi:twitching motility protein PilT